MKYHFRYWTEWKIRSENKRADALSTLNVAKFKKLSIEQNKPYDSYMTLFTRHPDNLVIDYKHYTKNMETQKS